MITTSTTIELLHGPGCGLRRTIRVADMVQSKSGIWCASIQLPHRPGDPALYALGKIDLAKLSPIQVYDAVFVGWASDFARPQEEGAAGC